VLLTSHLGRPKGKEDKYSLAPVADRLTELLGKKVTFVEDCIGDAVASAVSKMGEGDVALLENGAWWCGLGVWERMGVVWWFGCVGGDGGWGWLGDLTERSVRLVVRLTHHQHTHTHTHTPQHPTHAVRFYKEEEKNEPEFAKKLAANADLYVNDAFGTAHRAHGSTEGACVAVVGCFLCFCFSLGGVGGGGFHVVCVIRVVYGYGGHVHGFMAIWRRDVDGYACAVLRCVCVCVLGADSLLVGEWRGCIVS
jgi:hypothetical protein